MVDRISVEEARRKASAGEAILVCGYDDETKCDRIRLPDAISMKRFERDAASMPKDREIIFYCA